jgi:hypothetical protein
MRNGHRAHIVPSHTGHVIIACAALWLASIGTTTAAGDLARPSTAPPVTKRTCAGYAVVVGQGPPAARCKAYTAETLRPLNQRQRTGTHAGFYVAPHPAASNHAGVIGGSPRGAGSSSGGSGSGRGAPPTGGPAAAIGVHTSASPKPASSSASVLALLAAIIAAAALAGAAALTLTRMPHSRRRKENARGPAF